MIDKNNEHIQAIAEYVTKEGLHYFGAEFECIETGEAFTVTVAKESALRKLTEENARLREFVKSVEGFTYKTMHTDFEWLAKTSQKLNDEAKELLAKGGE